MGNATSSALRTDDPVTSATTPGADGPAFGSLSTLGGPRKFKKKPVLVLDPEELEKAHMLFQDASAELLGEDVERPERSAPLLGLAPMDLDDSEADAADMSDDDSDIIDDDIPSAEDVLRMTAARPAPDETDDAAIAEQLEGLDFDHRIFPSLPLKPEDQIAAEEEAERLAAERAAAQDDASSANEIAEDVNFEATADGIEETGSDAESAEEFNAPHLALSQVRKIELEIDYAAPLDNNRAVTSAHVGPPVERATRSAAAFPVNPLPEPEAELVTTLPTSQEPEGDIPLDTELDTRDAGEPIASAQAVFGEGPFLDFPSQRVAWVPESRSTRRAEPAAEAEKDQFSADHADSEIAGTAEDHSNRFEWAYEDENDDAEPLQTLASGDQHLESREPEPEERPGPHSDSNFTEVEDDQVDGYAFMYAHNPRGRTIHALAEGESNSLRAKLIKEREAALTQHDEFPGKPSIWARFTRWFRSLLG